MTSEDIGNRNATGVNMNHKYDCYIHFSRKWNKSCEAHFTNTPQTMLKIQIMSCILEKR